MIKGLQEVEQSLRGKNIPFSCLMGDPGKVIPHWIREVKASGLITDFDPLRIKRSWKEKISRTIEIPFLEVDAHNIVPCWTASPKQEYGAYTLRPKIQRLSRGVSGRNPSSEKTSVFLGRKGFPGRLAGYPEKPENRFVGSGGGLVETGRKGRRETCCRISFGDKGCLLYAEKRNDPNEKGQSGLSPYLHFGQLSAQRMALEVGKKSKVPESRKAFLEELIVRRELSDNFCFYNPHYDHFEGFPAWAQKTLNEHRRDTREYLYNQEQFEKALTHDPLWNAAQMEMVRKGKMHGYLRMYWAKKILEWTPSPEEALRIAIYLNDRYELDGRDPNGYTGIAWSLGGVHDRAWGERPVFGKIRYMSFKGAKSKFDVARYIAENLNAKT